MPPDSPSWLLRRLRAFADAARGLTALIRHEPPAWLHLLATVLTLALAAWLRFSAIEWTLLFLTIAAVWTAEAFNTAIEKLCDALHPDQHPQIGRVKDLAAAGVLVAALAALAIAAALFGPKLCALL